MSPASYYMMLPGSQKGAVPVHGRVLIFENATPVIRTVSTKRPYE